MARDTAKKSATDYKWEKENCIRINLKIRKDTGLVDMIDAARVLTDDSRNSYAIKAIQEKLQRDGYLKKEE